MIEHNKEFYDLLIRVIEKHEIPDCDNSLRYFIDYDNSDDNTINFKFTTNVTSGYSISSHKFHMETMKFNYDSHLLNESLNEMLRTEKLNML